MPMIEYEVTRTRTQKHTEIWDRYYAHCMTCGNQTLYTNKAGGSCDVQYACVYCGVMFTAEEATSLTASTPGVALLGKLRELDPSLETPIRGRDAKLREARPAWDQETMKRGQVLAEIDRRTEAARSRFGPGDVAAVVEVRVLGELRSYVASVTPQASSYTRANVDEPEPAAGPCDQGSASMPVMQDLKHQVGHLQVAERVSTQRILDLERRVGLLEQCHDIALARLYERLNALESSTQPRTLDATTGVAKKV